MVAFDRLNINSDIKKEVLHIMRKRSSHENLELFVNTRSGLGKFFNLFFVIQILIQLSTVFKLGEHFMSDIYRVQLKNHTESLILKVAPTNLARRQNSNAHALFKRKKFMYDKVSHEIKDSRLKNRLKNRENVFHLDSTNFQQYSVGQRDQSKQKWFQ